MTVYQIINTVVAGGLLGMLGQGIRIAVGLKKLNDSNVAKPEQDKEPFSASRLVVSIFIGFVAGALGIIVKGGKVDDYSTEMILAIIATGYSGADFIEGVFNTSIPKPTPAAQAAKNTGGGQTVAPQPLLVNDESKPANQVLG